MKVINIITNAYTMYYNIIYQFIIFIHLELLSCKKDFILLHFFLGNYTQFFSIKKFSN